jgi:hypothetical protein
MTLFNREDLPSIPRAVSSRGTSPLGPRL